MILPQSQQPPRLPESVVSGGHLSVGSSSSSSSKEEGNESGESVVTVKRGNTSDQVRSADIACDLLTEHFVTRGVLRRCMRMPTLQPAYNVR